MPDRELTHAELVALRILADLGGRAMTREVENHVDWTTTTHYHNLRGTEYVEAIVHRDLSEKNVKRLEWRLTDAGCEAVRKEAAAWMRAEQNLADEEVEA